MSDKIRHQKLTKELERLHEELYDEVKELQELQDSNVRHSLIVAQEQYIDLIENQIQTVQAQLFDINERHWNSA